MVLPPPNLPFTPRISDGDDLAPRDSHSASDQAMANGISEKPLTSAAGTVPGGGEDAPDPFMPSMKEPAASSEGHRETVSIPHVYEGSQQFSGQPSAASVGAVGALSASSIPVAPPSFQQPQPRQKSRRWITLIIGSIITLLLLGAIGVVAARLFLSGRFGLTSDDTSNSPAAEPSADVEPSPVSVEPSPSPEQSDIGDPDSDGLTNAEEQFYGTKIDDADSDDDGFLDGQEVRAGYDPLSQGKLDSDNDGFADPDEREFGSDPYNPDTDADGYSDGDEIANGYNPLIPSPGDKL